MAGMDMVARAKQSSPSTPMVINLSLGSGFRYLRMEAAHVVLMCVRDPRTPSINTHTRTHLIE